jgi:hypothetical protein
VSTGSSPTGVGAGERAAAQVELLELLLDLGERRGMGVDVPDDRIATRSGGRGVRPGGWLDRLRMGLGQGGAGAGAGRGGVGPGLRTAARGEGDGGRDGERRDQQSERRGAAQLHTGQWPLAQEQTGSSAPAR